MLLLLLNKIDDNERWKKKLIMERRGKRRRRKKFQHLSACCKKDSFADDRTWKIDLQDENSGGRSRRARRRMLQNLWLSRVLLLLMLSSSALLLLSSSSHAGAEEIGEGLTLSNGASQQQQQQQQGAETLTVQQLERIKLESKVSASVGQNVILNCAVQFKDGIEKPFVVNWLKYPHKLPIYIWYAGYPPHVAQGYESRVSRIGQASLNLTRVRESDQGLYECKIYYLDRRPEDKANGTWIFLDVQAPPRFIQTPAPISYVQAGDSLHLTCQAESTPAPTLRWYKNKTPIDSDNGAYRLSSLTSQASAASSHHHDSPTAPQQTDLASRSHLLGAPSSGQLDLFIDNVQAGSTTGEYRCLASNSEGSVEARSQVVLAVPAIITELPRNQTRVESERLEFTCQAKALPANITYKWLFNDKPMQQLKWFEGRHTIRRDGTLVIHSLHRDDQGHYKCQATNGLSHRQRLKSNAEPNVGNNKTGAWNEVAPIYAEAGAFLTVEYPARVVYSPPIQYLPLGLSGVIRCHWEALPQVLYYDWSLNGKQFDPDLDNNMERLKNGSLLVRQVNKQYEGKYMCTPFNKHGTLGSSAAMEVRVADPPEFDLKPAEFYKANLNSHIKIPCSAKAHPRASVGWRRVLPASSKAQTTDATGNEQSAGDQEQAKTKEVRRPAGESAATSDEDEEQQSVITRYAKLPSDRSEYKNSHLLLHTLHKDDHGRYECFIENEAATLIASTMLYIEDTSPHAPSDVQVETKSWSARISWQPGYDGGFEQSFVIWYRQVPKSADGDYVPPTSEHEPTDLSWRSVIVQPSDATSFTVQNLTQDTSYEFYVRAKNIIGEGPRSQVVSATTKRALTGSLTPVRPDSLAPGLNPSGSPAEGELDPNSVRTGEYEDSLTTINTTVMGIIHLVYTTESPPLSAAGEQASGGDSNGESDSQSQSASQVQQSNESTAVNPGPQSVDDQIKDSTGSNTIKVIRINYLANKQTNSTNPSSQSDMSNQLQHQIAGGNKRPRFDQPDQQQQQQQSGKNNNNSEATASSQQPAPEVFVDYSTAPQNVSLMKVAQGWVINWLPPLRPPTFGEHGETAAAITQPTGSSLFNQLPSDYWVEYREKGGAWQSAAASRDTKLLLKELRPGSEYFFRVYAIGPNGMRGSPSQEMKHLIPDNRRKPGGTQAISAGVVSGVLFFVACIVIAVCAVNMCNKRRKKRAEKAAYVMMACPVLESHHDIAALNSNSLMKNSSSSSANPSQSRVSGVKEPIYHLAQQLMDRLTGKTQLATGSQTDRGVQRQPTVICRDIRYSSNAAVPVDVAVDTGRSVESAASSDSLEVGAATGVDQTDACNTKTSSTPLDDYWIRKPSDRKWGTLTVAASRLAERRAREASLKQSDNANTLAGTGAAADADSLADEYYAPAENSIVAQPASSQTLPRFFGQSLPRKEVTPGQLHQINCQQAATNWQLAQMSERSHQQFNDWLRSQLTNDNPNECDQGESSVPPRPPLRAYQREISRTASQQPAYHLPKFVNQHDIVVQPIIHHQRSISHIEPTTLNNYWMQQQQYHQMYSSQSYAGPVPAAHNTYQFAGQSAAFVQTQVPSMNVGNFGKRNSLQRSTLPLTSAATSFWPQIGQQMDPSALYPSKQQDDDDPVTANACLGSNKRKSRRPNIMEKYTITPPAVPPKLETERDAVASGHLFVRSLAPPPPPPPPGQRREHQRLRPSNFEPLSRVESIGVDEKIESYLRHQARETAPICADEEQSPPEGSSPIDLGQVRELTFQPYQNLPQLKYTINLPLEKSNDGTLLLAETSHLRRSRRERSRRRSVGTVPALNNEAHSTVNCPPLDTRKLLAYKRRLGSSSSCPAPPAEFDDDLHLSAGNLSMADDSTFSQKRFDHLPPHLRPIAADSLEEGVAPKKSPRPFYLHSPVILSGENPPPVPLHRSTKQELQVDKSGLDIEREQRVEVQRHNSSDSSRSPNSSTSPGSSSSSSSATTTENGGAASEALTNDHSVDEQYEFDMIPSARRNGRNQSDGQHHHHLMNGVVYTRVVKQNNVRNPDLSRETEVKTTTTTKSQLYCDARCKQVPLAEARNSTTNEQAANSRQSPAANNDLYDTVYDVTTN